jgi:ATP-dependent helicase HrpB
MPRRLPIYDLEDEIIARLGATRRLVLQAPTGSGKSTQVPQMLLRHGLAGDGRIVTLQPRRLAARLLARRVANELGVELGREVGYQVRFENRTSAATRIQFETEGILLRQWVANPTLSKIQAVVFDEFHERHLYGDITLALALDIQERCRPDLLIVVMSATLDSDALEKYLDPCAVLRSDGRAFPVDVDYLPRRSGKKPPAVWDLAAEAFRNAVRAGIGGDVLVFMPGGYEIRRTLEAIGRLPESKGFILLPLYGELPPNEQDSAVARYEQPKVVVATNVAETSITIDGVALVIDSGLARILRYDPHRGINSLLVEKISRASADQRTGRAGRTTPGRCVRLWSESEHAERAGRDLPEVRRLDLAEVVLLLKAADFDDIRNFRWLEPPNDTALAHAEELLGDLGALHRPDADGDDRPEASITDLGRRMVAFPVHPRYARMLLAAQEYRCVRQACLVAALTGGRDLLLPKPGKEAESRREDLFGEAPGSDVAVLIRAWEYAREARFNLDTLRKLGIHQVTSRQVGPLFEQFLRIAFDQGLDVEQSDTPTDALWKCILIGFSDRVARRLDEGALRCELVRGGRGTLARESAVRNSPLLVAAQIREVGGRGVEVKTILTLATGIELQWLRDLFPAEIRSEVRCRFDTMTRRVQAEAVVIFRDLVVGSHSVVPPPADASASVLAGEVMAGRLQLPKWDHGVTQWIIRLNLLAQWCPDLELSPIHDQDRRHILEQLCEGAASYKDIKNRNVRPVVQSWLPAGQRDLVDRYAPERILLSNGKRPRVTYNPEAAPYISLRIQDLFGVDHLPAIAMGRVPVAVHVLAPSMRPVQVTEDLASFWREHYPQIKSELQRKYPKHEWR